MYLHARPPKVVARRVRRRPVIPGVLENRVAGLAAGGELAILVVAAFPLDQAGRAVALVESGHAAGNVVVLGPLDPSA